MGSFKSGAAPVEDWPRSGLVGESVAIPVIDGDAVGLIGTAQVAFMVVGHTGLASTFPFFLNLLHQDRPARILLHFRVGIMPALLLKLCLLHPRVLVPLALLVHLLHQIIKHLLVLLGRLAGLVRPILLLLTYLLVGRIAAVDDVPHLLLASLVVLLDPVEGLLGAVAPGITHDAVGMG